MTGIGHAGMIASVLLADHPMATSENGQTAPAQRATPVM